MAQARRLIWAATALVLSAPAFPAGPAPAPSPTPSGTLVTVNGEKITRSQLDDRLWGLYANQALNQMVDQTLFGEALQSWQSREDSKEKRIEKSMVAERVARIRRQFKDEAEFKTSLKRNGTSLSQLESQIGSQVARERMVIAAQKISVTADEVKDFFDKNRSKLGVPQSVHVLYLLAPDRRKAEEYLAAIRAGADFGKLLTQLTQTGMRGAGGDLGFVTKGMLAPDIEKIVFGLKIGEVSPIVQTPNGFGIFKVIDARSSKTAVFDQRTRDDIKDALLLQKVNQALPAYLAALRAKAKIVPAPGVTMGGAPQPPQAPNAPAP